jgi:hypothetical protein
MNRPHLPRSADDRAFWAAWLELVATVAGIALLCIYLNNVAEWGVL